MRLGQRKSIVPLSLAMLLLSAFGLAQFAKSADGDLGQLLTDINQTHQHKVELEMQLQKNVSQKRDIEEAYQDIAQRKKDYDQKLTEFNNYCSGEFQEPEYTVRKNWCDGHLPQLEQARDEINNKLKSLESDDTGRLEGAQSLYQDYQSTETRLESMRGRLQSIAQNDPKCRGYNTVESLYCCMSGDNSMCNNSLPIVPDSNPELDKD